MWNEETVQTLTRIKDIPNISHQYLSMTCHSLDSSPNSGLFHLFTSLEQICELCLCLGTKCVFSGYILFHFSKRDRTNINFRRPLERTYLSACTFFVQYIVPLLVTTKIGFKIFRVIIKTMFNYRTFSIYFTINAHFVFFSLTFAINFVL